jgi:threonine aldolase
MRQVGVLCAAAYVALRDNVPKLSDDHRRAKILAGSYISQAHLVVFSQFSHLNCCFLYYSPPCRWASASGVLQCILKLS